MSFVRTMDWIELAIFPGFELCSCNWRFFCQLRWQNGKHLVRILLLWFPQAKHRTQLLWYFLRRDFVSLICNRSANYKRKCRLQICFFLVSSEEAKSLSVKARASEFPAALSIGELFTGSPCSDPRKRTEYWVVLRQLTTFRAGFEKNWERIDKAYEVSGLVEVASSLKLPMSWRYKWRSNFSYSDSRNSLGVKWSSIGL